MNILRRLKLVYSLNNFFHKNALLCNEDVYKKYGLKKSLLSSISSADLINLKTNDTPWLDNAYINEETITKKTGFNNFSASIQSQIINWPKNGHISLQKFYSEKEVDTINSEIEIIQQNHKAKHRLDERIIFSIRQSKLIYELSTKPKLIQLLSFILGKKVKLFQSLNFLHGSEQRAHSDTIHMTTFPLGYLIAAWIALEDIHEDSGPLFYHPESHKLPYVLNADYDHGGNYFLFGKNSYQHYEDAIEAVVVKNNLPKKTFLAKKGDVFIWHANLLHGGSPIVNPALTRKSMVLHFFAEEVICYHEITERPAIFGGDEGHCPK